MNIKVNYGTVCCVETHSCSIEMGEQPLVKTVANVFRDICYANRDGVTAGIICAGWDKRLGGQVLSLVMTCLEDIKPAKNYFFQ